MNWFKKLFTPKFVRTTEEVTLLVSYWFKEENGVNGMAHRTVVFTQYDPLGSNFLSNLKEILEKEHSKNVQIVFFNIINLANLR